eukprot:CAMPEP_0172536456 /NCGR_PEP_ID=MMETSP1067-20121228/8218_1 /TAXON_ID=265564 ORGANISM="Thalassiosira punctigera, Strain Tpunct2005C2" /NCGR_SAMPLE_ID=MMETSP1067 /ASSEMBLY_ACC=CAM_ASM_000444 /LENGTH=1048 /DNA_ID=CAMNT_0013321535 /DNA_START=304 /DNA_END=3450 /DNA_ORIENTATION=-
MTMKCPNVFAAMLLSLANIGLHFSQVIDAHKVTPVDGPDHGRRRLDDHVNPEDNIADYLNQQHAAGISRPQFTLVGLFQGEVTPGTSSLHDEEHHGGIYNIDVVEANPSVTDATIVSIRGEEGSSAPASDYGADLRLLVSANHAAGDFVLLTVDGSTNEVVGMAKKAGEELLEVRQAPGSPTVVTRTEEYAPPDGWTCGVGDSMDRNSIDGGHRLLATEHEVETRDKSDESHHHHHHYGHEHDDDDHEHDQQQLDLLTQLKLDLGENVAISLGKRRALYPTDLFPQLYSYQVDFYIEIDQALVDHNVNMAGAINYVNAIVTATSAIYEKEIDTHLNVIHIALSSLYNNATNTAQGLNIMESTYGGTSWHYVGTDLHHALLHKSLGGGRATIGAICDPEQGFGISTGIDGTINDIGPMYWDVYVFAHEVGHNFGAQHTHDSSRIPKVDECGVQVNGAYTCPANPMGTGAATIMSYCHQCSGGTSNIGPTFGGIWNEDDRTDIDNWLNDATIGSFNIDAKRVSKGMYEFVSSQTCTSPNGVVPEVNCSTSADCFDGNSCTVDTCSGTSQCINTMTDNCCGNFICEANEYDSCSDCALSLATPGPSGSWYRGAGMQFDVEAIADVFIQNVTFYPDYASGSSYNVNLYTAPGGYSDKQTNPSAWTKIIDSQLVSAADLSATTLSFADIAVSAGTTQAFYLATPGNIVYGTLTANPVAIDANLKIMNPARSVATTEFGGEYSGGPYSWSGAVSYKIRESASLPPPSTSPTNSPTSNPSKSPSVGPTNSPTTPIPTTSPTISPTSNPSKSPSISPTNSPTTPPPPTTSPTRSPTFNPSKSPSISPTNSPTVPPPTTGPTNSPTSNPSKSPIVSPTNSPTTSPPTTSPTVSPTSNPSKSPTIGPTTSPTVPPPTNSPTTPPPTTSPTASPTSNPSKSPSVSPTNSPTFPPPTNSPTTPPPTTSPTTMPTSTPSKPPSASPSNSPTVPPPTGSPTSRPKTMGPTIATKQSKKRTKSKKGKTTKTTKLTDKHETSSPTAITRHRVRSHATPYVTLGA